MMRPKTVWYILIPFSEASRNIFLILKSVDMFYDFNDLKQTA
jgi:hypothetical protein